LQKRETLKKESNQVKLESLEVNQGSREKVFRAYALCSNIPASDTQLNQTANQIRIRTWGEIPQFNFPIKNILSWEKTWAF